MPVSRDPEKQGPAAGQPPTRAGRTCRALSLVMQSGSLAAPRSRGLGPTPALTPQAA